MVATYSAAALMRESLPGRAGWVIGLAAFHLGAALALRFLTNAKYVAASVAACAAGSEMVLFRSTGNVPLALSAGTLAELIPAMYFAQRFFLTMGD